MVPDKIVAEERGKLWADALFAKAVLASLCTMALMMGLTLIIQANRDPDIVAAERQAYRDMHYGLHCLTERNGGYHPQFVHKVKSMMIDPDSFGHISTKVGSNDGLDNRHDITMRYYGSNKDGDISVFEVRGDYGHSNCRPISIYGWNTIK